MSKNEKRPLTEIEERYRQGFIDGYLSATKTVIANSKKMYDVMLSKKEGVTNE